MAQQLDRVAPTNGRRPATPPRPRRAGAVAAWADDRLGLAKAVRGNLRKVFPDHWSFMLGEIALWSFVVLLLTGTFLTLWFTPSMSESAYQGSYQQLRGVQVSDAYASTMHISFDVRGGLLVRQMHHWAAMLFVGAMMIHLMRVAFTGAFRKPRELNWVIGSMLLLVFHKHTQWAGPGRTEQNVVGYPMMPVYMAKAGGFFFMVFGVTALMGALLSINPVWKFGPYDPSQVTAGSQPDWYMGWPDGALRIMPNWESTVFGHPISWNILVPIQVLPVLMLTVVMMLPFV